MSNSKLFKKQNFQKNKKTWKFFIIKTSLKKYEIIQKISRIMYGWVPLNNSKMKKRKILFSKTNLIFSHIKKDEIRRQYSSFERKEQKKMCHLNIFLFAKTAESIDWLFGFEKFSTINRTLFFFSVHNFSTKAFWNNPLLVTLFMKSLVPSLAHSRKISILFTVLAFTSKKKIEMYKQIFTETE